MKLLFVEFYFNIVAFKFTKPMLLKVHEKWHSTMCCD